MSTSARPKMASGPSTERPRRAVCCVHEHGVHGRHGLHGGRPAASDRDRPQHEGLSGGPAGIQPGPGLCADRSSGRGTGRQARLRRLWFIRVALGCVALISIAIAPAYVYILPAMAALGLVTGAFLDGTINPLIAGLYGERSGGILNTVHLFFGLGATVTPFLVSLGLRAVLPWRWHFVVVSGLVLAIGVSIFKTRLPDPPRRGASYDARH